jgi:hypothetical protein
MADYYSRCPRCLRVYLSYKNAPATPCLSCWVKDNPSIWVSFPRVVLTPDPPVAEEVPHAE